MEREVYRKTAALEERHWWFLGRRQIITTVLEGLSFPPHPKILEIGCGSGGNFSLLARFGEVYGVEMDKEARNMARERRLAAVLPGSLPHDLPYQGSLFDLIVMLDVLEHVEEDEASLQTIFPFLQPGGYLLVTVPALPALWSSHDESHHHKRRYTKKRIRSIIQGSGYVLVYLSYINCLLFPAIASMRILNRFRHPVNNDDLTMPPAWLNQMLACLFGSEIHLIWRMSLPLGISLLLVAQKSKGPNSSGNF